MPTKRENNRAIKMREIFWRNGAECEFFAKLSPKGGESPLTVHGECLYKKVSWVSHKNEMSLHRCVYAVQTEYQSRIKDKTMKGREKGDKCEFFAKLSPKESGKK